MSDRKDTTNEAFFEQKYRDDADPWDFASSAYERSRYAAIFAALNHRRYTHAFEPGCSVGVLTQQLAAICDRVDATDISPTAVQQTAARCRNLGNVHTTSGALPALIPAGNFDLIVFSEIGYYFDEASLHHLATVLTHRICTSGVFLAAHWLGASPDHILTGDRVHEILATVPGLRLDHSQRFLSPQHDGFRLDRYIRQ